MPESLIGTPLAPALELDPPGPPPEPAAAAADVDRVPGPAALAAAGAGVRFAVVVGFLPSGEPLVRYEDAPAGSDLPARTVVPVGPADAGREAVVAEAGPGRPVILGLTQPPGAAARPAVAEVDGERVTITAGREVVLRCGAASITLTKAGKVVIRGEYVLTRASGTNRIRGGNVQIN